jgi:hypothetical protein
LASYSAKNGTAVPASLLVNPFLSWSDRTLQGILSTDGVRVNNLTIESTGAANLQIKSTEFELIANSIDYEVSKVDPHALSVPAFDPLNWTYLTQAADIPPAVGADLFLDPTQYDNGGVLTPVGGGVNNSTVQLVMISPVKEFIILYGQQVFSTYEEAVQNARSAGFIDTYVLPPALFDAVGVAFIAIKRTATDSGDLDEVSIINIAGGSGGSGETVVTGEFLDGDFKLLNSTDNTKTAQFEASKQATSTNKIHKLPSENSELSTLDLPETMTALKSFPSNNYELVNQFDPTKKAEFVLSDNQTSSTKNSYIFPERGGFLLTERNQRTISGNYILTDQDIREHTVLFADNGATDIDISIPDSSFNNVNNITVVIIGTGDIQVIPLGSTTINGSGSSIIFSGDQYRIIDFYHEGQETQDWRYDSIDYRKLTDNTFNDSLFTLFNGADISKSARLLLSQIPTATANDYNLPIHSGNIARERDSLLLSAGTSVTLTNEQYNRDTVIYLTSNNNFTVNFGDFVAKANSQISIIIQNDRRLTIDPQGAVQINGSTNSINFYGKNRQIDLIQRDGDKNWYVDVPDQQVAFVKFNPNKLTNGEVGYRNSGIGFRVFRTGTGTFQIENDGTVLNDLPSNWATRAASGALSYVEVDSMIAGIAGFTANIESWTSSNGPQTGQPGALTLIVRNAAGTLTDVTNANGHIYIKYLEL